MEMVVKLRKLNDAEVEGGNKLSPANNLEGRVVSILFPSIKTERSDGS
jgi:hypothetical protein